MSNNNNIELTDENLLKLMIRQFYLWSKLKQNNLLILNYDTIFKDEIVPILQKFLKKDNLSGFPIPYIEPKNTLSTNNEITNAETLLFEKYKLEIDYINNYNAELR